MTADRLAAISAAATEAGRLASIAPAEGGDWGVRDREQEQWSRTIWDLLTSPEVTP